jgi:hypothetical protein
LEVADWLFLHRSFKCGGKKNLLEIALRKLFDIRVQVVSVTCDGPVANFSTLRKMGASFDLTEMK